MSSGYLVSCIPTKDKPKLEASPTPSVPSLTKQRLLKRKRSVARFLKTHIKQDDSFPIVSVKTFNSNGYHTKEINGADAIKTFVEW